MHNFDCLVIGSGIAGLSYALKVAERLPWSKVALVTKTRLNESNTKHAQGGIAVVTNMQSDSFDRHFNDTIKAGDGLNDPEIVKMVVEEGPIRLKELIGWQVDFDKQDSGEYQLGLEGGHSQNRILHHKDKTGLEIERKLLQQVKRTKNIAHFTNYLAIELITNKNLEYESEAFKNETCLGAYLLNRNTGKVETFVAQQTLLASGGIGQVYKNTTNPVIATGDGIALALRSGTIVEDMEFIQFHPTALYNKDKNPLFLISEAVRGFGAKLRTKDGKSFLQNYDDREELASRDIISRAIETELQKSGDDYVCLDCRHLNIDQFKNEFPAIFKNLELLKIDPAKDLIPVVPAAHYLCGGIKTNKSGATSLNNLFATGECARTGLHGANRLASNSLLEALVFSHESAIHTVKSLHTKPSLPLIKEWTAPANKTEINSGEIANTLKDVQAIMSAYVGIKRIDNRLLFAKDALAIIDQKTEELYKQNQISVAVIELRNIITVAKEIIAQSLTRSVNKGGFYKILTAV